MRLVLFTAHYPYGLGEEFLENELRIAEKEFSEIMIVCNAKASECAVVRYLPTNARVVLLRKDQNTVHQNISMLRALLIPRFWKEFFAGCKERGLKCIREVILKLLLVERSFQALQRTENEWLGNEEQLTDTVFYSYWLGPTVLYLKWRKISNYRAFVSRAHGGDCFFDRGYLPWRKDSLDALDAVFTISEMGRKDIVYHYGDKVPKLTEKVHVARLGVSLPTEMGPIPDEDEQVLLVTCSNVIKLKRLDLLVEALHKWSERQIRWVHFGDGVLMNAISLLAQERLAGNPSVSWEFRGRVSNEEVLEFYRNMPVTLFVNCSDAEGIPVSVMEAMAYGIPALARAVGGNVELVDNSCGMLLPEDASADVLFSAIHILISEQSRNAYLQMRQAAHDQVKKRFNATNNYELFWRQIKESIKHG